MKNNETVQILGVRIDLLNIGEINNLIIDYASKKHSAPMVVFKPYVEFLSLANRNKEIRKLLNSSDYNIADSTAVQWASSYLYGKPKVGSNILSAYYSLIFRMRSKQWSTQIVPERMAGVDQTIPLLKIASEKHLKIGVLGGPRETEITKKGIAERFSKIKLFVWSGYFNENQKEEVIADIAKNDLDILFVAMGFPRQEKFIIDNKDILKAKVIIGEGGSFDYNELGGPIKRAPKPFRRLGLEWFWRLILQPKRIRRQLSIPYFISEVSKQKKSLK